MFTPRQMGSLARRLAGYVLPLCVPSLLVMIRGIGGAQTVDANQIKIFEEMVKDDPKDLSRRMKLGEVYYLSGEAQKAHKQFSFVVEQDSTNAKAWVNLGNCSLALDRTPEAIDAFERAIEIDPTMGEAYTDLGVAHLRYDANENAVMALQKAIGIDPSQALAHYHLAEAYLRVGETQKGIEALRTCTELAPQFMKSRIKLASVLETQGFSEEAAETYEQARELSPTDPAIHLALAKVYDDRLHDAVKALKSYRSYLRWLQKGDKSVEKRMHALTEKLYVSALEQFSLGEKDAAIQTLHSILEINPDHQKARDAMKTIRQETPER